MNKLSWVHVFLYLLLCKVSFNQRAHHRLRGASGADVWKDKVAMGLLCIANPTWIKTELVSTITIKKAKAYLAKNQVRQEEN